MDERQPPELAFTHTRLLVTDYAECVRFYRNDLGFELVFGDEDSGYADFRTGDTTLALFDRSEMAAAVGADDRPVRAVQQDDVALVFRVESVDRAYERLHADAEFVTDPHDQPGWGIRVAHLRDPAGTLLELNESLEEA